MDHRLPGQPLSRITVNVSMDDLHISRSFHIDTMQLTDRTMTTVFAYPVVQSDVFFTPAHSTFFKVLSSWVWF